MIADLSRSGHSSPSHGDACICICFLALFQLLKIIAAYMCPAEFKPEDGYPFGDSIITFFQIERFHLFFILENIKFDN